MKFQNLNHFKQSNIKKIHQNQILRTTISSKNKKQQLIDIQKQNLHIENAHKQMDVKYEVIIKNMLKGKNNIFHRNETNLDLNQIIKRKKQYSLHNSQQHIRKYLSKYKNLNYKTYGIGNNNKNTIILLESQIHQISTTFNSPRKTLKQTERNNKGKSSILVILDWQKLKNNWTDGEQKVIQAIQRSVVRDKYKKAERQYMKIVCQNQKARQQNKQSKQKLNKLVFKYRAFNNKFKEFGSWQVNYQN